MVGELEAGGARLDGLYVCMHHPSEGQPPYRADCDCRKPRPGLLHARGGRARSRPARLGDGRRQALRRGGGAVGGRARACSCSPATGAGSGSTSRRGGGQAGPRGRRICSTRWTGRSPAPRRGARALTCSRSSDSRTRVARLRRPPHRGGRRSHRGRVPLRQARAHLARGARPDPALHRARGAAGRRGQRGPQRARARRAPSLPVGLLGQDARGRRGARALPPGGHPHRRRSRARRRAAHAGQDAHHGGRLRVHAPAGGAPRPRARAGSRGPAEDALVEPARTALARRAPTPSSSPTTATAR